jgi:hypothetical protein
MRTPSLTLVALGLSLGGIALGAVPGKSRKPVSSGPSPPVVSVCDALLNRAKYQGQMISIRGLVTGTMEGAWLVGEDCGPFVAKGYPWPAIISLDGRSSPRSVSLPPAYDEAADARVEKQVRKLTHGKASVPLIVTYTGIFESFSDLGEAVTAYPNGYIRAVGFGHGCVAPAQLVVQTLRDPEIGSPKRPLPPVPDMWIKPEPPKP